MLVQLALSSTDTVNAATSPVLTCNTSQTPQPDCYQQHSRSLSELRTTAPWKLASWRGRTVLGQRRSP